MSNVRTPQSLVSIIIRTKNRENVIGKTLAQVFKQDYSDYEVIIVDSGSTDATLEIALKYSVQIYEISENEFSFGRALNYGFQKSNGEFIVALSAHCVPAHTFWLSNLVQPLLDNPNCAGAYGRKLTPVEADPYYKAVNRSNPFNSPADRVEPNKCPLFSNSNSCIRRSIWEQIPFDENVIHAEDAVWAMEVVSQGWIICYKAEASVYHMQYHQESFRQIFRREYSAVHVLLSTTGDKRHIDTNTNPLNVFKHLCWRIPLIIVRTMLRNRVHLKWLHRALIYQYAWYLGPLKAVVELKRKGTLVA